MATKKTELLLAKFEENISLEKFYIDQSDRDSLLRVLNEQEDLIPELLRLVNLEPGDIAGPLWNRLQMAADARLELEKRVAQLLGEISKELGRLRQSTKKLHDWQKAWHQPEATGSQFPNTYA